MFKYCVSADARHESLIGQYGSGDYGQIRLFKIKWKPVPQELSKIGIRPRDKDIIRKIN